LERLGFLADKGEKMVDFIKHSQAEEDYLESILLIAETKPVVHRIDVARKMGVSQAAVNKAVKILLEKGFVEEDGKHLVLTSLGKNYADEIFQKHCIIRDFLISLGVSKETAEEDACRMEHLVSNETFQKMKEKI
jgi:Mn-dependent DtxR family transcriptional regulator